MTTPISKDTKLVTIKIDDKEYQMPAGANLVDVAKWYADNDIPVFCYHPKMEPVGMCRMCVVELGSVMRDRETGEVVMDDNGEPQVRWFPKLQTACTQRVSDGMVVRTNSHTVRESREHVVEFLLTSHPLDCPICDKGGECPLQNLTMAHGPQASRMYYSDKMHLGKHLPLGDLIYLDQERCIQCARCIRFQDELVGDDVLAFHERGRRLQIITKSDPGFDTYFSGNTTDICPVGALTTADFRFGARPWELTEIPSISPWDAAGENISLSMRLDRDFGGRAMIKRVMPRQNEFVNEIFISDKTRFGHHFTRSADRVMEPMARQGDSLTTQNWPAAYREVADVLKAAGGDVAAIAGGAVSNEDLWELRQLVEGLGGSKLGAWPPTHGGADLVAQVGVGQDTNLGELGKGDAILVIATDLEEEVPMWRFRAKRAQDRGAYLVVANARGTRMEEFALQTERNDKPVAGASIRYAPGEAVQAMLDLKSNNSEIYDRLVNATNLVVIAGAEGLDLAGSKALMQACANFLIDTGHVGKANNGLLSPIPGPNGMGLHYLGFTPEATQDIIANPPKVLIVAQAEVAEDDPMAGEWLSKAGTVITLSLFPDRTTQYADYVLPIQSFAERDGTFVNGERRVQRFYTAQGPMGEAIPAWKIFTVLGEQLGQKRAKLSAAAVMLDLTQNVPQFADMRYKNLSKVVRQFPDVGGDDLYYGGTAYQNKGGIGLQIPTEADSGTVKAVKVTAPGVVSTSADELVIIPTTQLYDRSNLFMPSELVHARVPLPFIALSSVDADSLGIVEGDLVEVRFAGGSVRVRASIDSSTPQSVALLPRHLTDEPTPMVPGTATISKIAQPAMVS
ncbi:molybdopterin-dependent oxidoreductase [Phototrophicus methaneseepsis]|uniref:Molybdopterin-dependent oxidoreductase n=1 Tax=Phototrophicus methaneseepsis TaxID=2710758 RepID=A0A7S8IGK8_9CHLR|nr:molybdopterin-dependent oxidoreductase [Phototrophicus methaneseepsis]QPC84764.1 molybdopterin-dependent oxidoreductase [Phototrophicus methaneseepsis]